MGTGEIDKSAYEVTLSALQAELATLSEQLSNLTQSLSNIDEVASHACVIASQLDTLWENGDFKTKVDLQNLLFPEGVLWDRNIGDYRTEKTNSVFETIKRISINYDYEQTKSDLDLPSKSLLVEKR